MIMRKFSKVIAVFMLILTASLIVPETTVPYLGVENVQAATKLSKTKVSIYAGKNTTLKITGTKSTVKWSTSKKSIATVTSKGIVTGKNKGTATITAKVGGKKYTCKVTVKMTAEQQEIAKIISGIKARMNNPDALKIRKIYKGKFIPSSYLRWVEPYFNNLDIAKKYKYKIQISGTNGYGETTVDYCYSNAITSTDDIYFPTESYYDSEITNAVTKKYSATEINLLTTLSSNYDFD